MTDEELEIRINRSFERIEILEREILEAARTVIPVLKDAGQKHSAEILELLFVEYDGLAEDARKLTIENLAQIARLALGRDR
jgi:hypothetical protein